jgi:RNA polymerase sigma factor (sigma-70 family)
MHRVAETPSEVSPETVRAWDALVRRHSTPVFRLAYRLTGNRADAEDITQEVLVRAMRSGPARPDDGSGAVDGWFHRVTTNLFVDMVRRRGRARSVSIDDRPWTLDAVVVGSDPADAALDETLDPDLEAALATLPAAFREAVLLCDVHGLSYAEIAGVVGAKTGTVRSRIHRGRALLRSALAHRAPSPGRVRHGGPCDEQPGSRILVPVGASGTMSG